MRWIWHQPGAKYGPVGVERKKPASQRGRRKGKGRGSQQRAPNEADESRHITSSWIISSRRRTSSAPFASTATVNQIAWKDNALVLLLLTVFTSDERCNCWRKRPSTKTPMARPIQRFFSGEPVKLISIPTIASSYNDEMNHVDRGDQRRSFLGYLFECHKPTLPYRAPHDPRFD
ncbi:Uncharacterized protein HZ326_20066 [Fusarium oxysporum f. sp. albedinis]|nr:Uncharacterized protein HZ326_20066 [Fusarium oxysporum f. sp. albedinis]